MTESPLKTDKIMEILAPSIGGAFILNIVLTFYFKNTIGSQGNLIAFALISCAILLLHVVFDKNSKLPMFFLAVFSFTLTIAYIFPANLKRLNVISALFSFMIIVKYILNDRTYSSVILINISLLLSISINGSNYLLLNRAILIVSATLFIVPRVMGYSRQATYSKFIFFAVIMPVIAIFITENIGYKNYIYTAAVISSVVGTGYFENAFKIEKNV